MASQRRFTQNLRSIAGMGLVGLGLFVLAENSTGVAVQWTRLVGTSADTTQRFGALIALGLAASELWRSYVFDRQELVLGVCGIGISFWPLLLVIAGAVLTGMGSRTTPNSTQNKNTGIVDLTGPGSTRQ